MSQIYCLFKKKSTFTIKTIDCNNYRKGNIYKFQKSANGERKGFVSPVVQCAITSKINGTPKGVYLPISKLHSILAVANLLAHNNKSQICYCGQISLE